MTRQASYPRVVVEGAVPEAINLDWRVVLDRKEDANGVLRDVRIIELHSHNDVDGLGVKRWRRVEGGKNATMSDWIHVAVAALDLVLQETK